MKITKKEVDGKILLEAQTTRKVVVELPYYSKDSCHYYKINEKGRTIQVTDLDDHFGIQDSYQHFALGEILDVEEIAESEFNAAFERVLNKFN